MKTAELIKKCHEIIDSAADDPQKLKIIYAFLSHLV